jgi:hypothetical protein
MILGQLSWKNLGRSHFVRVTMSRGVVLDASPPMHRGMNVLDKSAFRTSIPVLAARVPAVKTGSVLKAEEMKGLLEILSMSVNI